MRIGILTFHLAHNYGAVLQCYALQEVLKLMGNNVWVINYQQHFIRKWFRPKRLFGLRSFIKAVLNKRTGKYIKDSLHPYQCYYDFSHFRYKYMRLTKKCFSLHDIPPMDLYVIGSDQPWNPDLTGGTDLVYYGQFSKPESSHIVTYAMSGSVEAISKVGWENVAQYLKHFDALSFRENALTKKISEITQRYCETVLDPILLTDVDFWQPMIKHRVTKRKYLLLYHVGGPENIISTMTEKSKLIANEQGLEFIDASRYQYSPTDFVSLIYHADYVVTASFHAMVFSIIFHKVFSVVRTGQPSDLRFINLLNILGMESCMMDPSMVSMPHEMDYKMIEERLKREKAESISYLKKISNL